MTFLDSDGLHSHPATAADFEPDHGSGGDEMPRPCYRRSLVLMLVLMLMVNVLR